MYKGLKHLFVKDSRERDNSEYRTMDLVVKCCIVCFFFYCKKPRQGHHCADIILFDYPKLNLVNKKIITDPNKLVYKINKI